MIKVLKDFYACPTCELREQDGDCNLKRRFHSDKNINCSCNEWSLKKNINPLYSKIAKILVKFNYYNN